MSSFQEQIDKIIAEEKLTFKRSIAVMKKELPKFKKYQEDLDKIEVTFKSQAVSLSPALDAWCRRAFEKAQRFIWYLRDKISLVEGVIGNEYEKILNQRRKVPSHVADLLRIVVKGIREFETFLDQNVYAKAAKEAWDDAKTREPEGPSSHLTPVFIKTEIFWKEIFSHLHVEALDWLLELQGLGNDYLLKHKDQLKRIIERQLKLMFPKNSIEVELEKEDSYLQVNFLQGLSQIGPSYDSLGIYHQNDYYNDSKLKKTEVNVVSILFSINISYTPNDIKEEVGIRFNVYGSSFKVRTRIRNVIVQNKRLEKAIRECLKECFHGL